MAVDRSYWIDSVIDDTRYQIEHNEKIQKVIEDAFGGKDQSLLKKHERLCNELDELLRIRRQG